MHANCDYRVALIVQIHLQQNRTDLALKEVQAAKRWAQDSLLVNLAESWVGMRVVCFDLTLSILWYILRTWANGFWFVPYRAANNINPHSMFLKNWPAHLVPLLRCQSSARLLRNCIWVGCPRLRLRCRLPWRNILTSRS